MICKFTKNERAELHKLIDALDAARNALVGRLNEIESDWQSDYDEKSEKWQEGDAGTMAQARLETLGSWRDDLDAIDLPDLSGLD